MSVGSALLADELMPMWRGAQPEKLGVWKETLSWSLFTEIDIEPHGHIRRVRVNIRSENGPVAVSPESCGR